jgi:hypothetical protein
MRCASFEVDGAVSLKIPGLLGFVYPPYYESFSTFRKKYITFILKGQINRVKTLETSGITPKTIQSLTSHKSEILGEIFLQVGKTTFCKINL